MSEVEKVDVLVLGAGLSGLSAARDLASEGVDVAVLEAKDHPGGRVERATLPDGRTVEMGGEVVGRSHKAYLGLVKELGLDLEPGYSAAEGKETWDLLDHEVVIADEPVWLTEPERADLDRINAELERLVSTVDPDDPLAHEDAARLDHLSVGQWAREMHALPSTMRILELRAGTINQGVTDRISLLSDLQLRATFPDDFDLQVAGGSSVLPLRMAEHLGERIRYSDRVEAVEIESTVKVITSGGATLMARAVICTIPAGPLRKVRLSGLSPERARSLGRQRHALMAKIVVAYDRPFWRDRDASGQAMSESTFSTISVQRDGVLTVMITPEKLAHHLAAPPELRRAELRQVLARLWGPEASEDLAFLHTDWGVEPFTLGGVATYAPGDLTCLGELHGKHEPPFFVAGSDHWRCGYLEGAVQTGRNAAVAVLDHIS